MAAVRRGRERAAKVLIVCYALAIPAALASRIFEPPPEAGPGPVALAFTLLNVPAAPSLLSAVLLALITVFLLQRKRFGLWVVAAGQVVGIYLGIAVLLSAPTSPWLRRWRELHSLGEALDVASIPIGVAVLLLLWWLAPAFPARQRPGSWLRALLVALAGSAVTVAVTFTLVQSVPSLSEHSRLEAVLATLSRAAGNNLPGTRHLLRDLPRWAPEVTSLLASLTLVAVVAVFVASARSLTRWSPDRELALRRLIREHGGADALAYLATRRDKSSLFSPDGRAAVTYRVLYGVSLASGDPIGEPDSWASAVAEWLAEARRYGWLPAAIGASERGARAYMAAGLDALYLGDEAVLDPSTFRLGSAAMTPLRRSVKRTQREGVSVRIRTQREIPAEELDELIATAESWLAAPERGFSMALNRLGDPADPDLTYVTAHLDDRLVGLLSFVPWGASGLSLDVMRHAPDAPNGTTERMVCELLGDDRARRRVSLNFCVFRRSFAEADALGAATMARMGNAVLGWFDRKWQLERLYRATERYQPHWEPRFACYAQGLALPWGAVAMATAEGFLPFLGFDRSHGAQNALDADDLAEAIRLAEPVPDPGPRRSDQVRARLRLRDEAAASGVDPYPPAGFRATHRLADLAGVATGTRVAVAARIRRVRDHGGVVFLDLVDGDAVVQAFAERTVVGADRLRLASRLLRTGDLVGVVGTWTASRTGTPSLAVAEWALQAKALQPVPWDGLVDPEVRVRQRTLDLVVHPAGLDTLRQRSAVVAAVRSHLGQAGFTEVETPILQAVHGGAAARPFRTHANAYDYDLSLRIAPELYLKRLVVAGFGPLFELGRNFRNEGADATHNPEFTSLEAYLPWADYTDMRRLTQEIVRVAAMAVNGRPELPDGSGGWLSLDGDWPVVPMLDAVSIAAGAELGLDTDIDLLLEHARRAGVAVTPLMGAGAILEGLYGELVEPRTVRPTFYTDFPKETSPLTRSHRTRPGLVERWDLVVRGMELGTAYTELTDPVDERERFALQSLLAAAGDPEAAELDEAFLEALEVGMPPTGGLGIGIDRLCMLVTGAPLRSLLAFPFVKPR